MRSRLLRMLAVAALSVGGIRLLERVSRPPPQPLARLAEQALVDIFGEGVSLGGFSIDPVRGVWIDDLAVQGPGAATPGLTARRVEVRHDLMDLLSGRYRPTALTIDGARVALHETEAGAALDVPFHLEESGRGDAEVPDIVVRDVGLVVRARPGSTRLRPGRALLLEGLEARIQRGPDGRMAVRGSFGTRGLGQDDVRILLEGWADPRSDALQVSAVWDPLTLDPALLDMLAPELAARLTGSPIVSGRLEAEIQRAGARGGAPPGEVVVRARWLGAMTSQLADLPGLKDLAPEVRERLLPLFGGGSLEVAYEEGRLVLQSLKARVGTALVAGSGWVAGDGASFRLTARLTGLDLEDPALRRALGPEGRSLSQVVEARGTLDADLVLEQPPGGAFTWEARVTLNDATFSYLGEVGPSGLREGFPYRMEHTRGSLRLSPDGVLLEGLEGRHGAGTPMRVLSHARTSWQGEETGFLRLSGERPELGVTIEALDVPVDADLRAGVAGSEFPGLLDVYRIGGVLDRLEVDVVRRSFDPVARAEVRITLDGETFAWQRFPLPLANVRGIVTLRRPALPEPGREGDPAAPATRRGREVHVDVRGEVEQAGGPAWVDVRVDVDQAAARGRLRLTARDVETGGALTAVLAQAPLTRDRLAGVWRWLDPHGRADLEGEFPLEDEPSPVRLLVRLKGVNVVPDAEAGDALLAVRDLTGVVQVVGDDVRLGVLTGRLKGTPLELEGRLAEGLEGPWLFELKTLERLPISAELVTSLERLAACTTLLPAGLRLDGGGRARLDVRIERPRDSDCVQLPRVELSDLEVGVRWGGGLALNATGRLLAVEGDEVRAVGLVLSAPGARIEAEEARFGPSGLVGRFGLKLTGYEPPAEVLALLPQEARAFVTTWSAGRRLSSRALSVQVGRDGSVAVDGDLSFVAREGAPAKGAPRGELAFERLILSAPDPLERRTMSGALVFRRFAWEAEVGLTDLLGRVEIDRLRLGDDPSGAARLVGLSGRIEGLRFADLSAPVLWNDGLLRIEPIRGTLSGGRLSGRFVLHSRAPMAYEGQAHVEAFDVAALRDDLAPTGPPYRGLGTLDVTFENRSAQGADLAASGTLTVRHGHLGDLPPIASLFAALSRVLPGETPPAFETLDAAFTLRSEVLRFQRLDLAGPLAKMPGKGTLDLSGQVDLTFTPDLVKSMLLPGVMAVPVLGDVLRGALQEQLFYAVRVHGDLSDTRTDLVPFPPLGLKRAKPFEAPPPPPPPRRRLPNAFR